MVRFNYIDGGSFMDIDGDMLVEVATPQPPGPRDMVWVRVIDNRTRNHGDMFWAYPSELTGGAPCPITN